ncbi:type IV pilus twitching motility protein PilT [Pseudomonas parafulva]|uniref:Twitching motility protein PilT n=1 Tax=Pseudomonas parafulva TaxID=157782 RepID=A0AAJ0LKY4_9PSED|nr:PilT/PilU family type 4a pilus ATPase [Pseudomonas parafulva]KTT18472.1 twitching motility protein PilT [Pseudomonas parafulva]
MDVTDLLALALKAGASDLHLAAGQAPTVRVHGVLQRLPVPMATPDGLMRSMETLLDADPYRQWVAGHDLDLALELPALGRFRVNLFRQMNGPALTFRLIPARLACAEALGLGEIAQTIGQYRDGLVLIGGPTGSGKTSTLAALLDQMSRERALHIVTLEDPIEVVHASHQGVVNQREVGRDCCSFAQGLRSALRQDPDVIVLGELRDLETIRLALRAAETGHLVLATVHTRSAVNSIDRVVEVFPAQEKAWVRAMLADSLRVVVAQVLVGRRGGGRVAAREVLVVTDAVRNLIREGRMAQLHSAMQTGAAEGMQTLDGAMRQLRARGLLAG